MNPNKEPTNRRGFFVWASGTIYGMKNDWKSIGKIALYGAILILPGGLLAVPILYWWEKKHR